jgi:fatty-acyl-CoA synthase
MAPLLARALAGRPDAKTVINLDGGDGPQLDYRAWRDAASAADPNLASSPGDVVFQLYTSGTTGHPKGVQITHANIAAQRAAEALSGDWARLRDGDVGLVVMPLYHVGGLMMGLVSICAGVLTVVSKNTDAKALVELIDAYQVTTTFLVPVLIQNLLDEAVNAPEKLAQVRALRYGAAAMPPALLLRAQATLRCGLLQVYGMTETTGAIAYLPPEDHCEAEFERRMKSCGKAMPGIDIKIMDANGADAAANCMGEICVRGDVVMKGYWRREAETALANGDGWYKSGDAGRIDDDGYIYLGDRIKDMIISGGENIYPAEVENALLEHPAVHEVAVIGVPDQKWGEAVKAFVVPRAAGDVDEASLIAFAAARIAKYKVPKIVTFVEALPRNPSGKVLKRELRALGI